MKKTNSLNFNVKNTNLPASFGKPLTSSDKPDFFSYKNSF